MKKLIGNAVVGQSGGPTAAINATLAGVIRGVKENVHDGVIGTLYGMRNGVQGLLEEHLISLNECFVDDARIDMLEHTPAAALGSCRKKLPKVGEDPEGIFEKLLAIFKKYDIRYFFYIGGNDSMDTVAKLSAYTKSCDYEMCIMGVPKTIDIDLVGTILNSPPQSMQGLYLCSCPNTRELFVFSSHIFVTSFILFFRCLWAP